MATFNHIEIPLNEIVTVQEVGQAILDASPAKDGAGVTVIFTQTEESRIRGLVTEGTIEHGLKKATARVAMDSGDNIDHVAFKYRSCTLTTYYEEPVTTGAATQQ